MQNLKLGLDSDSASPYFEDLDQGTEVYNGELEQFRAVTDQAQVSYLKQNFPYTAFYSPEYLQRGAAVRSILGN